jgi:sugar lactone lactonase YvrE
VVIGSVHLFVGRKEAQTKKAGVTIPNSLSWSPDGKTMYFTETIAKKVFAYDYSGEDHAVSNERIFYQHEGPGGPDGHRVDMEGNMWHAIYGESRVIKISPEGRIVGEIKLPTQNITCTEFVGTELFITTAKMEPGSGSADEVDKSGALYRVDVGVEGVGPHEFILDA